VNSSEILKLLAERHSKDVFIPECKDGPSQGVSGYLRMDAWVMPRSWSKMSCICYEIKISRSDFLKDKKWQNYLKYCNEFYFAAPHGIIDHRELPPEAGLLVCSKNGARLFLKKAAVVRKVEIPESLWMYLLMCRVKIKDENYLDESSGLRYWKAWMEKKIIGRDFGYHVSQSIQKRVREEIEKSENEIERLCAMLERYQWVDDVLKELNLSISDISKWDYRSTIKRKIKEINGAIPEGLERALEKAIDSINTIKKFMVTQNPELLK
jgi:hypothetical protein